MVKVPESSLRLAVEIEVEDRIIKSDMRPYLGISSIADDCARKLWYGFRLCAQEDLSPRQNRLFGRGHNEEPIIIRDLEAAGMVVHSTQLECITGNGHIRGHNDAIIEKVPDAPKTPHLGEFKTANDKNFAKAKKDGLIKAFPVYWGQMIVYMNEFGLKRGLFIMVNKNTDERYYERVYPDKTKAKELIQRGVDIISSEVPLEKIGNATFWKCKWCKFYDICQYGGSVLKNCRTCDMCDICDGGIWSCSRHGNMTLAFGQQLIGCDNYELLKTLK